MKPASEMRAGMAIRLSGDPYRVIHAEYHAGGGKMHGAVNTKLKSLTTGSLTERRFRPEERFEELALERHTMEYLYDDSELCIFMHPETYEQVGLPKTSLGPFAAYLQPNQLLQIEFLQGEPIEVSYPSSVDLEVRSTAAPIHLDDSSLLKDAVLENGLDVQVPQFIKEGDIVRIEVDSGKYLERVR